MGAIGSYRGCDSCRKWKKKCDGANPECSRCKAKNIPCLNLGKQRFKFKDESTSFALIDGQATYRGSHAQHVGAVMAIPPPAKPPTNSETRLARSSVYLIEDTNPGFNVRGFFCINLPSRIGHSPALDASLAAIISTLESIKESTSRQKGIIARRNYISGLEAIQKALSNPKLRYDVNTLWAANLLYICHGWMEDDMNVLGHAEGIAHLLSVLAYQSQAADRLRDTAMEIITANLMQESIFNPNIQLYPWFQKIVACNTLQHQLTSRQYSKPVFKPLDWSVYVMMQQLIRQPRENMEWIRWAYHSTAREAYPKWNEFLVTQGSATATTGVKGQKRTSRDVRVQNVYRDLPAVYIAMSLPLNAFLRTRASDSEQKLLAEERAAFCAHAIRLADETKVQRPLAAYHIPGAIAAAWCVADSEDSKQRLRQLLEDYRDDFSMRRFLMAFSKWREAPEKLSREIPWFPAYKPKGGRGSREKRDTGAIDSEMYEYCCIL